MKTDTNAIPAEPSATSAVAGEVEAARRVVMAGDARAAETPATVPPDRHDLDNYFWSCATCKRASKPVYDPAEPGELVSGDRSLYLLYARKMVTCVDRVLRLMPPHDALSARQDAAFCWALYALAVDGDDAAERKSAADRYLARMDQARQDGSRPLNDAETDAVARVRRLQDPNAVRFREAYEADKAGDPVKAAAIYHAVLGTAGALPPDRARDYCWTMAKRVWDAEHPAVGAELHGLMCDFLALVRGGALDATDEKSLAPQRVFVRGLAVRFHRVEKETAAVRSQIPADVATLFAEIFESRGHAVFVPEDFRGRPVPEDRRNVVKAKDFPSPVETCLAFLAHCFKACHGLVPGPNTLAFVGAHLADGKWFRYYYGTWLLRAGRREEAIAPLAAVARAKPNEAWAWQGLADAFAADPAKRRACLCRALVCPARFPKIAEPFAARLHAQLAELLERDGQAESAARERDYARAEHPLPGDQDFYARYAQAAAALVSA